MYRYNFIYKKCIFNSIFLLQIRECLDHTAAAMDGSILVEALHGKGINVRYLGKLADMLSTVPQLQYLKRIAVSELILRSAKHIFTFYMQVYLLKLKLKWLF